MANRYTTIPEVLDAYARRDGQRRLTEGALALALIAGLAVAFLVLLDAACKPPAGVRLTALLASLGTALAAAALLGWRALRTPSQGALAIEIEARSPSTFSNTLVTAVDCLDPRVPERFGWAPGLVEACRTQALAKASAVDVPALTPWERAGRLALAAAALTCVWGAVLFAQGDRVRDLLAYRYLVLLAPGAAGPVQLDVKPGDQKVLEGSRFEVLLTVKGRQLAPEDSPVLKRQVDGAGREESIALAPTGPGQWAALFPSVLKGFRYRVEAGPFESARFEVRVVPPPRIAKLTLKYTYPAYTALPEHVQERPPYDVSGPVGTKVAVQVEATKPLTSARLALPGAPVALAKGASDRSWAGSFEIKESGPYAVEITDTDGFGNPSPERYQILAVTDRVPRVLVLEPGRDLSLKPSELTTLAIKLDVTDDYGIRQVKLKAKLSQKIEYDYMTSDEEHVIAEPSVTRNGGAPAKLALDWTWDFTRRVLQPGDTITYFIEASDYYPGTTTTLGTPQTTATLGTPQTPGGKPDPAHVGVSKTYTIRIPFVAEVMAKTSEEEDQQLGSIEDVVAKQKALEERIDKVMKDVRNQREVGYKEKKELDSIVQRQKEIKEKAQDVANKMKETLETLKKNDLVDPGTVKKLSEIQQLFSEVADSKMKENMERLKDLMQQMKMDPDKMSKLMQQFDKSKYAQQLDRILKSLKRMKQQQELDRAIRNADELVKKQEELRSDTAARTQAQKPTQDLAKQQQDLKRDTESLMKNLPKLAEEMSKEFKENAPDLDRLSQEAKNQDPTKDMEDASESLKNNQSSKAYKEQSDAHQKLQKMRQSMKDMQEKVKQKQSEVNLQALIAMVAAGLRVSAVQERVYADAGASANVPDLMRKFCLDLAGRQYVVVRGTHRFEKDFEGAFPDDVVFKNQFLSQIAQLIEDQQESKKNFEDLRLFSAKQLSERSLSRLNVILVKLMDALNQLQDQQQSDGSQSMFDQMQKMIESQRKLNQQAQRLKPGEQMSPFQMQMMQQMAMEQEMIRQGMEKMAQKYGKAKDVLGDMDGLAKEMKEVEQQLKKFDRSAEAREKQEHVLTRMLDMEKSIHKQGKTEKREAEHAREFAPVKPPALSADMLEVRQKLHENLSRETYPPQHKKVVEDYFKSF